MAAALLQAWLGDTKLQWVIKDVNISVADYSQSTAIIIVDEAINTPICKKYTCEQQQDFALKLLLHMQKNRLLKQALLSVII